MSVIAAVCMLALAAGRRRRQDAVWRSGGYAEREDDLFITHGVWFRTLTAVPYGRMQVVNVNSGPIQRALGLATIELVTASASTNASIPGLPAAEATRLRDHLTEVGEEGVRPVSEPSAPTSTPPGDAGGDSRPTRSPGSRRRNRRSVRIR